MASCRWPLCLLGALVLCGVGRAKKQRCPILLTVCMVELGTISSLGAGLNMFMERNDEHSQGGTRFKKERVSRRFLRPAQSVPGASSGKLFFFVIKFSSASLHAVLKYYLFCLSLLLPLKN